jgi:hypothetical protein
MDKVTLSCQCGALKGQVQIEKSALFHVQCLCCDCQRFAKALNQTDAYLDQYGATELLQTYPDNFVIEQGDTHLACLKLHSKGLLRWYASCCNTPIANTIASSTVPFVGILVNNLKFSDENAKLATIGPISIKAFAKHSLIEPPVDSHQRFPLSFLPKIAFFMMKGKWKKRYQPSPFFNQNGQPTVTPHLISNK